LENTNDRSIARGANHLVWNSRQILQFGLGQYALGHVHIHFRLTAYMQPNTPKVS